MRYLRIYSSADGQSHFEDVELSGEERQSPVSTGVSVYSDPVPVESAVFRRVVTAHPEAPHCAPRRQFAVQLRGRAQIEVSSGEVREIGPGDVVLLEDLEGMGHTTREIGADERVTLFIELP